MTKQDKVLQKFHSHPTSLRYLEIKKLLVSLGCVKIPAKGSHIKFKHHTAKYDLVIPVHNLDCKDFYKKSALKFILDNHLDPNV